MQGELTVSLSERQEQIMRFAAEGLTDKEISVKTGLSHWSIKTYWDRMRVKFEARSRSEVIAKALVDSYTRELDRLRAHSERVQTVFESFNVPLAIANSDRRLVHANAAFADLFGLEAEVLLGTPLSELAPPHSPDINALCGMRDQAKSEIVTLPGAGMRYLETRVRPVLVREKPVYLISIADLTAYAPCEGNSLVANVREASRLMWTSLPDGFVDSWNDEFLRYAGLSCSEVKGVGCRAMMPAQDVPESHVRFNKAVKNGVPYEALVKLRREDGEIRRHLIRIEPLKTAEGEILRWVGSGVDVEHTAYLS